MMEDEYRGSRIAEAGFYLAHSQHGSGASFPEVSPFDGVLSKKVTPPARKHLRNTSSLVQRLLVKRGAMRLGTCIRRLTHQTSHPPVFSPRERT